MRYQKLPAAFSGPARGILAKGFESTQSLHPTPQNKVPDRSASELFHPRRERCAGAYARAELLVGSSSRAATLMVSP
jgi:hypothetical protein